VGRGVIGLRDPLPETSPVRIDEAFRVSDDRRGMSVGHVPHPVGLGLVPGDPLFLRVAKKSYSAFYSKAWGVPYTDNFSDSLGGTILIRAKDTILPRMTRSKSSTHVDTNCQDVSHKSQAQTTSDFTKAMRFIVLAVLTACSISNVAAKENSKASLYKAPEAALTHYLRQLQTVDPDPDDDLIPSVDDGNSTSVDSDSNSTSVDSDDAVEDGDDATTTGGGTGGLTSAKAAKKASKKAKKKAKKKKKKKNKGKRELESVNAEYLVIPRNLAKDTK
jgi:hypothetical protein